ncbi:VWA domain-containing protein [Paludisphaera mucosa]|uniref:VWA domain-containing protein n=1 Tax=Paludisphaera mucosa TaxID=3030827 RepID=A0ABT6FK70_9BACT|nr:VWA domain-containing protein [Paludisphaera mucosa]MDG3007780.1 VWA domain-containing protein [Paludisphaera mucosa]
MERRFSAPSSDDLAPPGPRPEHGPGEADGPTLVPSDMQKTLVVEEPLLDAPPPADPGSTSAPAEAAPRVRKLQPRRRRRVRLKHILPAWSVSLVVHLVIFTALGAATFSGGPPEARPIDFDSALGGADRAVEELPILDDPTDARPDRLEDRLQVAATAPAAETLAADERPDIGSVVMGGGAAPSATPSVRASAAKGGAEGRFLAVEGLKGRNISSFSNVPPALGLDVSVSGQVGGDPTFGVTEIGEALNQLTREILRHLNDHKLTVVWLFDESASMRDDQRVILEKFDRVSSELAKVVDPDKKAGGALNHAIVGFGKKLDLILDKPTLDVEEVRRAIKRLPVDSSGEEATMAAILNSVNHYSGLVAKDRKLILVLVTDESGDDGDDVEPALEALKKTKTALYVIGRQAVFGHAYAHHKYVDPVTKDVYYPTIRRGPESADVECYQWDGLYGRWDEQPSGFGPWELARLTKESGGIYFLLPSEEFMRIRQREKTYTIEVLKEYMPEYVPRATYLLRRDESDLRRNLFGLVAETRDVSYRREFPIDPDGLREAALEQIPIASERLTRLLDIQKRLESLKKHREREPERRWRAHYDLMLAQTVAFQVKTFEYRALMENLAAKPQPPTKQSTPDVTIVFVVDHSSKPLAPESVTAKKYADARRLLDDVVAEYPDTPWSDLAKDTLGRGFSVVLNQWEHSPKYGERSQYVPKY